MAINNVEKLNHAAASETGATNGASRADCTNYYAAIVRARQTVLKFVLGQQMNWKTKGQIDVEQFFSLVLCPAAFVDAKKL